MFGLAWLVLLILLTLYFNEVIEKQNNPNQHVLSYLNENGRNEVKLLMNRQGHYVATGEINQQAVIFLIDTGATHVAIPANLANKLKLKLGRQVNMITANGMIAAYTTVLDEVKLGDVKQYQVKASITPAMPDDHVLLGMSFLKHLEMIQKGNQMILRMP